MPTPKRGPRLGGGPAHQKHLLANQARDLFRHGRIRTTEAKAKALRPYAEKLITKAKRGDLHNRRLVLSELKDRDVVAYLFDDVAPRFADREGGYTRILKMEPRKGDNAPMALIELLDQGVSSGEDTIEESKAGRSRGLFGRRRKNVAEEAVAPAAATGTALLDPGRTTRSPTRTCSTSRTTSRSPRRSLRRPVLPPLRPLPLKETRSRTLTARTLTARTLTARTTPVRRLTPATRTTRTTTARPEPVHRRSAAADDDSEA